MTKFDLVVFDCDGVLVDSEHITNRVLCDMLNEHGCEISVAETMRLFIGRLVRDAFDTMEQVVGRPLPEDFHDHFVARRNAALVEQVRPIAGVREVLTTLTLPFCVASGADREKTELSLGRTGLLPLFDGRVFCGAELARTKPAPDVYLHAANTMGFAPARCVAVEDSPTGVTAGVAAGMTVFGFTGAGSSTPESLLAAGAVTVFHDMAQLPQLLNS